MKRVGVRELRRDTSAVLRRVADGETIEVTDRGRPVALIVRAVPGGLDRLMAEGKIRHGTGDLLDLEPVRLPRHASQPSERVSRGRDE